jgi:acetolactate synthase-1/2/3 large subunit
MRGGELIAEYLIREKVPYVFGLCGHGIVGLMDALAQRADRIKMIGVHHEQIAGYMADAYWRVAHRPAATFTSCGPGSVNLAIALAAAMMDSSALVAVTGNVPTPQFNRGPFQETYRHHQADFPSVIRPYVKRSFQVPRPEMLPLALRQAFKTAVTGRPGPVNVDVPLDVFVEEAPGAEVPDPEAWWHGIDRRPAPSPEVARRVLDLLTSAERPAILVGNGAMLSEAAPEVRRLAERLGAPVANTPQGAGVMPADHPLAVGVVGRNGTYPANQSTRQADVLLALGARFDDRVSSGWVPGYTFTIPPTRLIHVDIDPDEIGRNYPVHLGVVADVKALLQSVLALPDAGRSDGHEAWGRQVQAWKRDWTEFNERRYRPEAVPVQPEHLVRALRGAVPRDAIVLVDVGVHHNWVVQQWPVYLPQTLLQSWGFAAMGFAVGGVLGARLAAPDRPAVAVCGDGGFLMACNAVATAVEYGIPATWVVWNNGGYVSIRDIQRGMFGKETTTMFNHEATGEPLSPDYAMLARACGADGVRVTAPGELGDALAAAIHSDRPTVVDVRVDAGAGPVATGTWQLPPLPYPEPNYPALLTRPGPGRRS